MPNFELERQYYPVLRNCAWMDASTTGAMPEYSVDAMCSYLKYRMTNGLNLEEYYNEWEFCSQVGEEIAGMINARGSGEIAFGLNQSVLFSIFNNALNLQPGDNVVSYDKAFPSMTYSWLNRGQMGLEARILRVEEGSVDPKRLFELVDARTKAITVCHVDKTTGFRHDLKVIGDFCASRRIAFGVDATQSCGAMLIDVQDSKIDFLASSGYKWLQTVMGVGFAYIKQEFLESIPFVDIGWASVEDRITASSMTMNVFHDANRYHYGGLPFTAVHGLSAVVRNYLRLGGENIQKYILSLTDYLYKAVEKLPSISILGHYPEQYRSGLVVLKVPVQWEITDKKMRNSGIGAHMLEQDRLRVGLHYYNNTADIDRLIQYLSTFAGK